MMRSHKAIIQRAIIQRAASEDVILHDRQTVWPRRASSAAGVWFGRVRTAVLRRTAAMRVVPA